ncbi:ALK and LTK ligand 2b-like [Lampris incognitus]|uniref:ALK and LTK ligand 2b-like n=1 Tax=Lampris incognitus TaxID=2546036 RepID=UPI0024B60858|nr:ALK and LTK ligand 2b-like [Lampris incognitus]
MSGLRRHDIMALVLFIYTFTGRCSESAPTPAASVCRDGRAPWRIADTVKRAEESRRVVRAQTSSPSTPPKDSLAEQRDLRSLKTERGDQVIEIFPRDLRKKEKFLQHLTGPLYFGPKCRRQVYRLYHQTRDCSIPAYFKRCARLLTRLAGSPRCTEG